MIPIELAKQFAVLEALKKGGYLVECLLQDTDLSGVEAPRWTLSYRDFRTGVLKPFITERIDVLAAFVTEVALEDTPLFLAGFQEVWVTSLAAWKKTARYARRCW